MLCSHCASMQEDTIPILKRELPVGVHFRQIMKYVDSIKEHNTDATDYQIEDFLTQLFFDDYSLIRPAPGSMC